MNVTRRTTLQVAGSAGLYGALLSLGLLRPGSAAAQAFDEKLFHVSGVSDTLKALGAAGAAESKDVVIVSPDIAENGAVVPVGVKSNLPKTESIALLVDKNPNALAGAYDILEGSQPEVSMRIKMGQSSDVVALVKADGKYYMAKKEIKVTLGGCGG
ncbi:MAG: thiosulfate oxidation carrier protein SoxY [Burkholderiales bacterium]|jgi:sulfur-oxidizing protein SoxY|nr:MAG: thiosulfate oxidation carrier protein SoxY [Burkholderiales bacterium]